MKWLADIAGGIISPITNLLTKRNDNKIKVKQQQIQRLMNSDDKEAEWESIQAESGNRSWKDEFVTVIIAMPIPFTYLSIFAAVLLNRPEIATAALEANEAIKELIPDYGQLLSIVCLAAIGIKAFKK